jgi:hypothetical protein
MMTSAIFDYFETTLKTPLAPESLIQMPLTGEGKVEDRVDLLYNQLCKASNGWLQHLQQASLIYIATHSQGTPVTFLLLSRLINTRIIQPHKQRVCILAMAGIAHGPFPSLQKSLIVQYLEKAAARELFFFCDEESSISCKFKESLNHVLLSGARVLAVSSWYDQVVPVRI